MSVCLSVCLSVCHPFSALLYCLYVCFLYAFVPHLVNQHINNLFSLWAASIGKHIASLAARHCAFFLSLHLLVLLCTVTVDSKLDDDSGCCESTTGKSSVSGITTSRSTSASGCCESTTGKSLVSRFSTSGSTSGPLLAAVKEHVRTHV